MLGDRRRLFVAGVLLAGVVALAAVRLDHGGRTGPEAVHLAVDVEGIVCADLEAVPAEASSDGLESGPRPQIVQDPRCEELAAAPRPGDVALPHHTEASSGNVVLRGELRFDAQERCFYVVADDETIGIVWPARFVGKVDPPRITQDRGSTAVAVGDRFELRGRFVSGVGHDCGPVAADSKGFIASGDADLTSG